MDNQFEHSDLQRIWGALASLLILAIQSKILLVMPPKNTPATRWCPPEEEALVRFLHEHRSEASGGAGNFKQQTFNQLVAAVAPYRKDGSPEKTAAQCKTKWKLVRRISHSISYHIVLIVPDI